MPELRGSTRARALVADRRGGARPGAGRKRGGKNLKKGWDEWVADIQAVTRSEFRRAQLRELARADPWRYLERIAMPLVVRSQPGTLSVSAGDEQMALPLVYVDMPGQIVDDRAREAEILGGGVPIEADYVRE